MTSELPPHLDRFPPDFAWGAATAAYQIEGGWDADGRGVSIWDVFSHTRGRVRGGETGDVACDHYNRWREDIDLMAELGLGAYRFSVSWPRVLADGVGRLNPAGLDFYDRLVDALLERSIEPFVTLYHWDLPAALQERGGWASASMPDWFSEYARVVAARLGDRVRSWITLNEPQVFAFHGYGRGLHAPGLRDWGTALRAAHHALVAHWAGTAAVRSVVPDARVGIAIDLRDVQPATDSEQDRAAAARVDAGSQRWFLDPLFGRGYPPEQVAAYGALLDGIDTGEVANRSERLDFLGVNYYTRELIRDSRRGPFRATAAAVRGAPVTSMGWEVYPDGLTHVLASLHRDYAPSALYVTENGAAFPDTVAPDGTVADTSRLDYLRRHLAATARAMEQGAPVRGYFVWSLMDNFEWAEGFSKRFGIVRVDYETQARTIKASGRWYAALIRAARRDQTPDSSVCAD